MSSGSCCPPARERVVVPNLVVNEKFGSMILSPLGCSEAARVLYCGGPSVGEVADCVDRLEKSERYGNDCQQENQRVRSCDEG